MERGRHVRPLFFAPTMQRITEQPPPHDHLERMSTAELLQLMNAGDRSVPDAVGAALGAIAPLVDAIAERMQRGGRLFYLGAGTSGRLGILDASECPPTFGVPHGLVVGLIAGGDRAIRKAVEFAEDDPEQGWKDLQEHAVGPDDTVIGIAASGTTPYVVGALERCNAVGILTGCITCNPGSPVAAVARHPIVVVVGPEFITGSTRLKSGTAQKLVLNMISTSVMVKMGRVQGNRMVDMQLTNRKLVDRGTRMVMDALGVDEAEANKLLMEQGSVRRAIASRRTK
jgi:N-acetylmuramic acid 6-phosphate etherase